MNFKQYFDKKVMFLEWSMDSEYLAAVELGNMQAAQEMVDKAARENGYTVTAYHGTNGDVFHEFDPDQGGDKTGAESAQMGIFCTDNPKVAQIYADNMGMGGALGLALGFGPLAKIRDKVMQMPEAQKMVKQLEAAKENTTKVQQQEFAKYKQRHEKTIRDAIKGHPEVFKTFTDEQINKIIESMALNEWIDDNAMNNNPAIKAAWQQRGEIEQQLNDYLTPRIQEGLPNRRVMRLRLKMLHPAVFDAEGKSPAEFPLSEKIASAKRLGRDGVIFKNIVDPEERATHYVVFEPHQIKSGEPVVKDEAGNIIPLSRRFNQQSTKMFH